MSNSTTPQLHLPALLPAAALNSAQPPANKVGNTTFQLVLTNANFDAAQKICNALGAHLATYTSSAEQVGLRCYCYCCCYCCCCSTCLMARATR